MALILHYKILKEMGFFEVFKAITFLQQEDFYRQLQRKRFYKPPEHILCKGHSTVYEEVEKCSTTAKSNISVARVDDGTVPVAVLAVMVLVLVLKILI